MSLPGKVISEITQQNIALFLRKWGYAQTMSRDIVFGHKSLGGLGWCDMEVEQGLHNLGAMISGMHNTEIVGSAHKAMMRSWFWASGLNPFQNEIPNITYDESIWPRTTAQFMSTYNIKIISVYPSYPLLRENDDYCRLLLNVISIADLTDASGKFVDSEMYQIKRNTSNKSNSICARSSSV
jgi:hypothetical protein